MGGRRGRRLTSSHPVSRDPPALAGLIDIGDNGLFFLLYSKIAEDETLTMTRYDCACSALTLTI
jgi:hypothetical protein